MDVSKGETIKNPGVTYDPDMRLTEAVAAVVEMHEERKKRGFGRPEEADFASFSKRWGKMAENEKDQLAQRLADFAGRVAAGPDVPGMTPLDLAITLAGEQGLELTDAGLAVVVTGAAAKKKDEDILPEETRYFTTRRKNVDGTVFPITVPIPQYNFFEVKGILDRMARLSSSPAPAPVSSPHP